MIRFKARFHKMVDSQNISEVNNWIVNNRLKLNQDKAELLLISSRYRPRPLLEFLKIGNATCIPTPSTRNLGVIFDQCFNLEEHVKAICKSAHYHIKNTAKGCQRMALKLWCMLLSRQNWIIVTHPYMASRSIYFPSYNQFKMQRIIL